MEPHHWMFELPGVLGHSGAPWLFYLKIAGIIAAAYVSLCLIKGRKPW